LYEAIAPTDPQLAVQILRAPPVPVNIGSTALPHLHDARPTADVVTVLATIAALLLITASLLLRHDRRSVARVGRRIAYLAVMPLAVFVILPRVLQHASGDAPQIAAALLRAYGDRVLPSAITIVFVGIAIAIGADALAPTRDGVRSVGSRTHVAVQRTVAATTRAARPARDHRSPLL